MQRTDDKRDAAIERQRQHDKLTPAQKLAKLDAAGHTATRERERLEEQLAVEAMENEGG